MPPPSRRTGQSSARTLAVLALGALVWAVLAQLAGRIPLAPGEGLALRWLRALGEHPVRGSLALALGLQALLPGPPAASPKPPEPPPEPSPGASPGLEATIR